MELLEELAAEVVRLASAGGLPILVTLALLLACAVGLVAARRLPAVPRPRPPPDPPPGLRPTQPDDPSDPTAPASTVDWGGAHDPNDSPPG